MLREDLATNPAARERCAALWRHAASHLDDDGQRWVLHDALVWSVKGLPPESDAVLGDCFAESWPAPLPDMTARTGRAFLTDRMVHRAVSEVAMGHQRHASPILFHHALLDLPPHHALRAAAADWCATEVAMGGTIAAHRDRMFERRVHGAEDLVRMRRQPPADAWHVWMSA
jgi:hypothetical protein